MLGGAVAASLGGQPLILNVSPQNRKITRHTRKYMNEFKKRFFTFLNGDPKPVFDHIRNIGISVSLIIAAAFIESNYYSEVSGWYELAILFIIINLSIIGFFTFLLNLDHGLRGISTLLFGEKYNVNIYDLIWNAKITYRLRHLIKPRDILPEVVRYSFNQLVLQSLILLYYISVLIISFSFLITVAKLEPKKTKDTEVLNRLNFINTKIDLLLQQFPSEKKSKKGEPL